MIRRNWTRSLLGVASATFWVSWWLMPDVGTNDAAHILAIVADHRPSVLASVVAQLVSCVTFAPAVVLVAQRVTEGASRATWWGIVLLAVGTMGMCADAFFHLLAYEMTTKGIELPDAQGTMRLMQTHAIRFLVPLMLPFFIGTALLSFGLHRDGLVSSRPRLLCALALVVALLAAPLVRVFGVDRRGLVLAVLGLFAIAIAWIGAELHARRSREQ